jgi:MoxR-like ATPase
VADLPPVTDAQAIADLIEVVKQVHAAPALRRYIVDLVRATRSHAAVELGGSPRASLALLRASRAFAAVAGRDYVVPDDVKELALPVLAHRLILSPEAQMQGTEPEAVVTELLTRVPIPSPERGR